MLRIHFNPRSTKKYFKIEGDDRDLSGLTSSLERPTARSRHPAITRLGCCRARAQGFS